MQLGILISNSTKLLIGQDQQLNILLLSTQCREFSALKYVSKHQSIFQKHHFTKTCFPPKFFTSMSHFPFDPPIRITIVVHDIS